MTVSETDRAAREIFWRTKLRRLRFDAEPLADQVEKYHRSTQVMSGVTAVVAGMFLFVFTAFRRPDIALILIAIILGPIVTFSWLDYRRLARDFAAYQKEHEPPQG